MKTPVLLASLALAVFPSVASAQLYDQSLPLSSATPADNAGIAPIPTPVPWEIDGSIKNTESSIQIQVSTQNAIGADGTLDQAYVQDVFYIYEDPKHPGNYTGNSVGGDGRWQETPGTYYWMASAEFGENPDDFTSPKHYYKSKVFKITVGAVSAGTPEPPPTQPPPTVTKPVQPPTLAPGRPSTALRVYSRAVSHGHAKLQALCTPAPCSLVTASWVKIGSKTYPGQVGKTTLTTPLLQHFYVTLPKRTLRAIRAARKHHRRATMAVAVGTLDRTGAIVDRDLVSFSVSRIA